jgi:UDP-N-acetylmuramate dehydrogenase
MLIFMNTSLKPYNTFGLEYMADTMIHVRTEKEAKALFNGELSWKKPLLILGGGSNILFTRDFTGTILCPAFSRIKFEEQKDEHVIVSAGARVTWDKLVEWTVRMGFSGLENLSGIPGSVGAVPVQNIGAYGTEVKDYITKVRTISTSDGKVRVFSNDECRFGYRTSVFKNPEKGKYLVTRVYFRLDLNFKPNLNYGSLNEEVGRLDQPTLRNVRMAVINIRQLKLPDPKVIGNAGSFFKNPVVSRTAAEKLLKTYPDLPLYNDPSGNKSYK